MEETMRRIAEALERVEAIQTDNAKTTQQYQQLRSDLSKIVKEGLLERPAFKNDLNAEKLAAHLLPSLLGKLPDPSAITAAGDELIRAMQAEREKIPHHVKLTGDFYGMASKNAFIGYMLVLISVILVAGSAALYYREEAQDKTITKIADELNIQQGYYQGQIEIYKRENPTYGKRYFPPFDKTKLQTLESKLQQEKATPQE